MSDDELELTEVELELVELELVELELETLELEEELEAVGASVKVIILSNTE